MIENLPAKIIVNSSHSQINEKIEWILTFITRKNICFKILDSQVSLIVYLR